MTENTFHLNNEDSFAPTVHSSDNIFVCQWMGLYGPCNHEFSGRNLCAHLREVHEIRGSDDLPVHCLWDNCGKGLKKESLGRHIKSKHLAITHPCYTCHRRYTRQYALNQHQPTCPGLQQME